MINYALKPGVLCFFGLPPKLIKIMKLVVVILFTCLMQVSASTLAQRISLSEKNASLEQVLKKIKLQTGFDVLYGSEVLNQAKKVNINLSNIPVDEALEQLFEGQPLNYQVKDKTIFITRKEPSFLDRLASIISDDDGKFADIRGVVRNERGEPLEGITVMVKGAKTGTRTNAKGEFVLKGVKKGDVLVFTGVAIEPFEYTVKDDKNIDLNLKARLVQLEEVGINYNTGYEKIPKERATGSFVFIDSAMINRRVDGNILTRLKNLVPGLLFDNHSGNERLQLRGMYSFDEALAAPLIVIDNFPYEGNINDINPNDVDNITLLRDAAAASIWGAKAGNGVIVITTKQGRFNQKMQISINSSYASSSKPDLFKLPVVASSEIVDLEMFLYEKGNYNSSLNNPRTPVSKVAQILQQLKTGKISQVDSDQQLEQLRNTDIRNDLLKYSYRSPIKQSHALNISGASNMIKYFISAG
jgi:TonB-dependent SusC/RagA subfamily outer membrane receptor